MACLTIAIRRISDRKTYSGIHPIEFYPVDSVIQPSNNLGLEFIFKRTDGKLSSLPSSISPYPQAGKNLPDRNYHELAFAQTVLLQKRFD